jgi:hypothetical protein
MASRSKLVSKISIQEVAFYQKLCFVTVKEMKERSGIISQVKLSRQKPPNKACSNCLESQEQNHH